MNKGKIQLLIEKKIRENFPNSFFSIENTSSKHKKHKQNIIKGEETHFIITLESYKFSKLSKLDRQKYLINILGDEIINNIHSFSLKLNVPGRKKFN